MALYMCNVESSEYCFKNKQKYNNGLILQKAHYEPTKILILYLAHKCIFTLGHYYLMIWQQLI